MKNEEKINLMLLALKIMGYNQERLEADGVWGPEATKALKQFADDMDINL